MTGNVTEITDPAGVRTCYEYDILGRKSRIYGDHGLEVRYGYDCMNRLKDIRYGNGVATSYAYDGDGNLEKLETKAGENVLMSFTYQYDGNGNRTAKIGMQRMAAGAENMDAGSCALDISYRYDIRGRLLEERKNGDSTQYAYDKAGNRTEKKNSKGKILYFYNEKNQLAGMEDAERSEKRCFIYDRQGGIVEEKAKEGVRRFVYNSRHQQIRVETQDSRDQTQNVQENSYDAEGLRFELIEDGKRTRFVYHDSELLYEEGGDGQNRQCQTSYHLGAGIDAAQRGKELSYYHRDEQLSTAFLTGSNGDVQNGYLYDAFGMGLEEQELFPNRIRYTGQQYDELTGQYYLRARYYNPVYGRFMQEDVYQGDGLNLYAYCDSNPVVYYDPSGYAAAVCGNAATRDPDDQTVNTRTEQTTQGNIESGSGTSWADFMSPEDAARYNRWMDLREAGLDQQKINDILLTNRGYRPDPTTYLSPEYINRHLELFSDGTVKISSMTPTGQAGPPGGTFVMPKSVADGIIQEANGSVSKLEQLLSLEPGALGDSPVRLDIAAPQGLRMPSGNELGANEFWIPGGSTGGGIPEAIIDSPFPEEFISTPIFE